MYCANAKAGKRFCSFFLIVTCKSLHLHILNFLRAAAFK
jgi:hypothetical protein